MITGSLVFIIFSKACESISESSDVIIVPSGKCPLCLREFPLDQIENHASFCKGPTKPKRKLTPLPKPVYHMLKDSQIKSKLSDLGLKTTGDRQLIIKRHSEYVLLHNAECDSDDPKSASELRRLLGRAERTWGLARPSPSK